jgi:isocitrate dehydrogenase
MPRLPEENHLRRDSLGDYLALAVGLKDQGVKTDNGKAKILAKALDAVTGKLLENNKGLDPGPVNWITAAARVNGANL